MSDPNAANATNPANGLGFMPQGQPILDSYGNDMRRTMDMQRQIDTLRNDRTEENQGPRVSMFGGSQADVDRDRLKQEYLSLLTNPTQKDLTGSGFYGGRRGQTAGGGEYAARLGAMAQALGLDNQAIANQAGNQTMLERERMQQGGADRRAAAGFAANRPYQDAQTEGLGFQNRAARQAEELRNKYFNAQTAAEKKQALEELRAFNGKSDSNLRDNFMTQDVYGPNGDKIEQRVIDLRTGEPLRTQQRTASDAEIKASAKKYSMTPEQVRAQLGLG
jgi:hypothetical protein